MLVCLAPVYKVVGLIFLDSEDLFTIYLSIQSSMLVCLEPVYKVIGHLELDTDSGGLITIIYLEFYAYMLGACVQSSWTYRA